MYKDYPTRQLVTLYLTYFLIIFFTLGLTSANLFTSTDVHSFKELYFGLWGYGWDGWHYLSIATVGYDFPTQAFFPLYPLLLRVLDIFLPLTLAYRINAVLVLPLLFLLYRFTEMMGIAQEQRLTAVIGVLFFPTSFFLQASYAETLFMLLSAGSLLYLLKDRYGYAAVFAAFASATRPQGLALAPIIALSYLLRHRAQVRDLWVWMRAGVLGVVGSLGTLLYFLFLQVRFGSYTVFFDAQREWLRGTGTIIENVIGTIGEMVRMADYYIGDFPLIRRPTFDLFFLLTFILLAILLYKKMRWELYVFSLVQLLLPFLSGGIISMPRFMLSAFPFLLLGAARYLRTPTSLSSYIVLATVFQTVFIIMFVNNAFVG